MRFWAWAARFWDKHFRLRVKFGGYDQPDFAYDLTNDIQKFLDRKAKPPVDYIVLRTHDDCEIRRNERAIWVHITNEELFQSRLKQKLKAVLADLERK